VPFSFFHAKHYKSSYFSRCTTMMKKWPYPNLYCTQDIYPILFSQIWTYTWYKHSKSNLNSKYDYICTIEIFKSKFIHACNEHIISSTTYYKCSKPYIHTRAVKYLSQFTPRISVQPSSAHLESETSAFNYQIAKSMMTNLILDNSVSHYNDKLYVVCNQ